ncbi:MAG: hypothetical protein ACYC6W_01575 [Nitrosotalea sp.]
MKLTDNHKNTIVSLIIALAAGGFFYLLHPLPPILIYEYTGPGTTVAIWNRGFNPATDVTMSITPGNDSLIRGITHSKINGEPIINLTSNENGIMYQIPHLYPQDGVTFTLITNSTNPNLPNVAIRSDTTQGIELTQFLSIVLNYLYAILGAVSIFLSVGIYFTLSKILKKYMDRHMRLS